ncbi:hypothetical protein PRIPAC_70180, partial [Pristionchus pacificus]
ISFSKNCDRPDRSKIPEMETPHFWSRLKISRSEIFTGSSPDRWASKTEENSGGAFGDVQ